jgi:hypothetical protein
VTASEEADTMPRAKTDGEIMEAKADRAQSRRRPALEVTEEEIVVGKVTKINENSVMASASITVEINGIRYIAHEDIVLAKR